MTADIIMAMDIIYRTIVEIEKIADELDGDVKERLYRLSERLWEAYQMLEEEI